MRLKSLELSGFKSFARATTLEFPTSITAIVGPNGSGKSNVKDAIQWVLGEQSMKSLRGKKGEDLIWNGSPEVPRKGKASVTLIFDNSDKKLPLEFDEVALGRKIFRDGLNEYMVNDSTVRMKDVVLLAARMGLGESKHNIIGQGEVDRLLMASPTDRRGMLEEALGLRVYQLKKAETERKLSSTEQNLKEVEALIRELVPHLRFLKLQAEKAKARETIEDELKRFERIYLSREYREIASERSRLEEAKEPLYSKQEAVKERIRQLLSERADAERSLAPIENREGEARIADLEVKRREIEREIGRLEGKLESALAQPHRPAPARTVDVRYMEDEIRAFIAEARTVLEEEDQIETVRSHLFVLMEDVERLLDQIGGGQEAENPPQVSRESPASKEFKEAIHRLQEDLSRIGEEVSAHRNRRLEEQERQQTLYGCLREQDTLLRAAQEEERDLAVRKERIGFDEERLTGREETLRKELESTGLTHEGFVSVPDEEYATARPEELRRRIERLRGKLEEVGGIDLSVVREYEETEHRHAFLTKELADVQQAAGSLCELITELEMHLKRDFREGFAKVKEEFQTYFRIIFGGGTASLELIEGSEESEEGIEGVIEKKRREGIEIDVNLPRKRIRNLAMLSGGERALTSIALLFALTAVSPPPFLILDETDAALDEANSQRYAAILKELAKHTQLLLITHNRETMKSAGVLYGITMGDDGVSKLLSLKLEDAQVYTNR